MATEMTDEDLEAAKAGAVELDAANTGSVDDDDHVSMTLREP